MNCQGEHVDQTLPRQCPLRWRAVQMARFSLHSDLNDKQLTTQNCQDKVCQCCSQCWAAAKRFDWWSSLHWTLSGETIKLMSQPCQPVCTQLFLLPLSSSVCWQTLSTCLVWGVRCVVWGVRCPVSGLTNWSVVPVKQTIKGWNWTESLLNQQN